MCVFLLCSSFFLKSRFIAGNWRQPGPPAFFARAPGFFSPLFQKFRSSRLAFFC
jgi:hypothetical protein